MQQTYKRREAEVAHEGARLSMRELWRTERSLDPGMSTRFMFEAHGESRPARPCHGHGRPRTVLPLTADPLYRLATARSVDRADLAVFARHGVVPDAHANIPPSILQKVGCNLHNQPNHPIQIAKRLVVDSLQRRYPPALYALPLPATLLPSLSPSPISNALTPRLRSQTPSPAVHEEDVSRSGCLTRCRRL